MKLVDILLLLGILAAVGLAFYLMHRAKKQGKHLGCGGDCSHCAKGCGMRNQ